MEYPWRQITVVVLFNCSILVTTTSQHRPLGKAEKSCKKTRAAVFYEVCTLFMHFFMGSSPFLFAACHFYFFSNCRPNAEQCSKEHIQSALAVISQCKPREVVIQLPWPNNTDIQEVNNFIHLYYELSKREVVSF
jgi:hypothetical protein